MSVALCVLCLARSTHLWSKFKTNEAVAAMWGSCTQLALLCYFKLHSKDEYFEREEAKKHCYFTCEFLFNYNIYF